MKEPVTSAKSYLQKNRRKGALRSVDKALSLSYEDQEKIMEALTDLVAEKDLTLDEWEDRMEDIEEILEEKVLKTLWYCPNTEQRRDLSEH